MNKVVLNEDKLGVLQVEIDGVNFGVFDDFDRGELAWFPRRTERLSGDQIIALGEALNKANKLKSEK
ncbi:hypothetical protein PVK62_07900 [Aliivibrio sp. S3MY1]|uniref:Uncharacterized protein n=1 Tax=Aliivibrio finisterrensis TaxID=511998 RepID=A0ABY0I7K2_9GAMM|nr:MULTISPECIES: hypothetical protein [Aliivibrio]MDD9176028.1 hypothetical protein [Aliivibrio sp. S3TY1]MDD9193058.1 hypothetical protein [Aliivibrio sp. S2TY2]MDD9195761.1 hypothetical protein [Aliivibrio sp. S3MY1]RYU64339.1 hypothetical protein ERW53_10400 [Aliivibrio finisterrensis]RYU83951.1 hypothetical protein ERW52_12240 [Aliivibrio finisterrensis]